MSAIKIFWFWGPKITNNYYIQEFFDVWEMVFINLLDNWLVEWKISCNKLLFKLFYRLYYLLIYLKLAVNNDLPLNFTLLTILLLLYKLIFDKLINKNPLFLRFYFLILLRWKWLPASAGFLSLRVFEFKSAVIHIKRVI